MVRTRFPPHTWWHLSASDSLPLPQLEEQHTECHRLQQYEDLRMRRSRVIRDSRNCSPKSIAHLKANDGPHVQLIALLYVPLAMVERLQAAAWVDLLGGVVGSGLITARRHQQMQALVIVGAVVAAAVPRGLVLVHQLRIPVQTMPGQLQLLPSATRALEGRSVVVVQLKVFHCQSNQYEHCELRI